MNDIVPDDDQEDPKFLDKVSNPINPFEKNDNQRQYSVNEENLRQLLETQPKSKIKSKGVRKTCTIELLDLDVDDTEY